MIVGTYSLLNLIQSEEFLLQISKSLKIQIEELKKARSEVNEEQKEAQKQGQLVKKMTNYMSEELGRLEMSWEKHKHENPKSPNLKKFADTETKLRVLRGRLSEFIEKEETISSTNPNLENDLHQYELFLLELTNQINSKIATIEKILEHLHAEKRESQQQKLLLREMIDLFNQEIDDLEKTFSDLKS